MVQKVYLAIITNENRTFLKSLDLYGLDEKRKLMGLSNSTVVQGDDGKYYGRGGKAKTLDIIDPTTGQNGEGETYTLPLDFRSVGISVLSQFGISTETQAAMFTQFMSKTKEERDTFVAAFVALDSSDTSAVQSFVTQMVAMLSESNHSRFRFFVSKKVGHTSVKIWRCSAVTFLLCFRLVQNVPILGIRAPGVS